VSTPPPLSRWIGAAPATGLVSPPAGAPAEGSLAAAATGPVVALDQTDGLDLVPLVELTDEELAAIRPVPDEQRLVYYPWLENLEPDQRDTAVVTAFRSLAARGLITPPGRDTEPDELPAAGPDTPVPVTIGVDPIIAGALDLRDAAQLVLAVQRRIGGWDDYRYWHITGADVTVDELVEPKGLHRLRTLPTANVVEAVLRYLNPAGVTGADGDAQTVDPAAAITGDAPTDLLDRLAAAHAVSTVVVRRPGGDLPPLLGVFALPDALVIDEAAYATGGPNAFRPVSADTLRRILTDRLDLQNLEELA
jgi:hypothetical protein